MRVGGAGSVQGRAVLVVVVVVGGALLSRIHFPPDHNAIIVGPLYCVSQHMCTHTDTHAENVSYSV